MIGGLNESSAGTHWNVGGKVGGTDNQQNKLTEDRKNTAKSLSNAVSKHAATQSAKREAQVTQTNTEEVEEGEEKSVVRELKNMNLSRVLNFVFRQLNQEYVTLIHLTNLKIGFSTGYPADYAEYSIHDLPKFINRYLRDGYDYEEGENVNYFLSTSVREKATQFIIDNMICYDYKDRPFCLVEEIPEPPKPDLELEKLAGVKRNDPDNIVPSKFPDNLLGLEVPLNKDYLYRFKSQPFRLYVEEIVRKYPELAPKFDDILEAHIDHGVDGVIVNVCRNILRTDAIIIEALLGKGMPLDDYALASQVEAIREKQLENAKSQLALDIVNMKNLTP